MSNTSAIPDPQAGVAINPHIHSWRIGEQAGVSSVGRCECGDSRDFNNSWSDRKKDWRGTLRHPSER